MTVSRVPFSTFPTTGSGTEAPVAASALVLVITALLTCAVLDAGALLGGRPTPAARRALLW